MWRSESFFRITLEVAYALCIVTLLFLFFGSEVCGRIPILKLALVIVALDSLANFFGGVSNRVFLPGRAGVGYALFSSLFVGGLVGYPSFLALSRLWPLSIRIHVVERQLPLCGRPCDYVSDDLRTSTRCNHLLSRNLRCNKIPFY